MQSDPTPTHNNVPTQILYSHAYDRVKVYLKNMLHEQLAHCEAHSNDHMHLIFREMDAAQIVDNLCCQMEAYWCNEYPLIYWWSMGIFSLGGKALASMFMDAPVWCIMSSYNLYTCWHFILVSFHQAIFHPCQLYAWWMHKLKYHMVQCTSWESRGTNPCWHDTSWAAVWEIWGTTRDHIANWIGKFSSVA